MGRFGQADKWGESLFYPSINHPYVYVDNSPTIHFDPIGTATFLTGNNENLPTYKEFERAILNDSVFIWQGHGNFSTSDKGVVTTEQLRNLISQREKPFSLVVLAACGTEYYTSEGLFSSKNAKSVVYHKYWPKNVQESSFWANIPILSYINDILNRNNSSNLQLTDKFVKIMVESLNSGMSIKDSYSAGYQDNFNSWTRSFDKLPILNDGYNNSFFKQSDQSMEIGIKVMPNYSKFEYYDYHCVP
jgi:hypothetical protein